ncbi:hypothetical protein POV27_00330 [Aureisphaera galaxeae]|uniref:tetratricopeptide repeat protein n=1 Tax=Aureisphaera galaxeae TaxID=1538023 RepID=UPI00234FD72E|nr:hypothetical protein [Aureisphaera galaxeae]MDC8002482.1 hypothetical protein [Aureisphaera galaxeae]
MGLFSSLFGKRKMTLEEMNEKNKTYISDNPNPKDDEDGRMREASVAMTSGQFEESAELYEKLAEDFPAKKGLYLSQVGAAYYFLKDFHTAISFYVTAKEHGADTSMMDDNIWEACEAIYNQENDKTAIERYLTHYPNGKYAKKAEKILST